ncbi:MAG: radical SAM family heme chaperone HemW [Bacteroidia bacterium]|nr:radical SAM family heme chaperone HemW [Bacteroidia bacterium]
MSGIYFHIPYCRTKCHYCDFYASNNIKTINQLVNAEIEELYLRRSYLEDEEVQTIYFGGGTPSVLSISHINDLLSTVRKNFNVSVDCEISLEANPEDLTELYLKQLYEVGINRLSIGIQSFDEDILVYLGRRHGTEMLSNMIETAQNIGFKNISLDLIYGIPGLTLERYTESIKAVLKLGVQHISAYALTIEKKTYFYKLLITNRLKEVADEEVLDHFNATIDLLALNGFSHYEVSSFSKPGFQSRHNSSYWQGKNYLGVGPAAHSFNGKSRQWNISSTKNYILNIANGSSYFEVEILNEIDKYNEYVLLGLRTANGISKNFIVDSFDKKIVAYFSKEISKLDKDEFILQDGDQICLSRKGILMSDFIIRKLFYVP